MRRLSLIASLITLALGFQGGVPFTADADTDTEEGFQVVVHAEVQGVQIPREALSLIFLKKAPRWGDGSTVVPVDQSLRSAIRRRFSKKVLGETIISVQTFWHRQMLNGVAPPPVKSSDEEVLSYVASTPGAIGYVSPEVSLPSGVRTITVMD